MRKPRRGRHSLLITALMLVLSGAGSLVFAAVANAAGTLMVTPSTNLTGSQSVSVSGSGFAASSTGSILECNDDPGQPTIAVAGNNVPVSCTNPLSKITSTDASGNVATTSFTIVEGTVGPPTTGTDSSGGSAANDATAYPCPPTAAQMTAGDSCVIAFGDLAGDQVTLDIGFSGGGGGTTTTTTATTTTTTTTTQPPTTATTVPCTPRANTSNGTPNLTVNPDTCLNGGTVVAVTGSGFDASSPGGLLECSNDPGQPTITVAGNKVPVSCTNPLSKIVTTTSGGALPSTSFSIVAGTVGPPGSGTDSTGTAAATDAAKFPCPPTATQLAAGDTCVIAFGDLAGKQATIPIAFVPAPTAGGAQPSASTTSASGSSSSTSGASGASGTAAATAAPSSSTPLAFTGAGRGLWVLGTGGLVLVNVGFLLLALYYRPAELLTRGGRSALRLLGRGT